jgi:hypothetical protein
VAPGIVVVRGENVMLDADLAKLYGVPTKALNRAVKRNEERFPGDFMFQLTRQEAEDLGRQIGPASLRFQSGTSSRWGGRRYLPYVFTEQGVAMLSSVLRSPRAILVNVEIMRAFVRLRAMAYSYKDLANKLHALEQKYDARFKDVFDAIRALMAPPPGAAKRRIGFRPLPDEDRPRMD